MAVSHFRDKKVHFGNSRVNHLDWICYYKPEQGIEFSKFSFHTENFGHNLSFLHKMDKSQTQVQVKRANITSHKLKNTTVELLQMENNKKK